MNHKRVLIGLSGNPEVSYSIRPEHRHWHKRPVVEEGAGWGIGGTSVDVAIGLKRLNAPATVKLFLTVGSQLNDPFRDILLADGLKKEELDYAFLPALASTNWACIHRINGQPTIDGGKQAYVADPSDRILEYYRDFAPDYVVVTGITPADVPVVKGLLAQKGYMVLNSRPELTAKPELLWSLVRNISLLVVNDAEMAMLLDSRDLTWEMNHDDCRQIVQRGAAELIVTCGERGSCYAKSDGTFITQPVIASHEVIDGTGAGDSFLAGFLTARLEGLTPDQALRFASCAALLKIRRRSGGNMPTRDQVETLYGGATP